MIISDVLVTMSSQPPEFATYLFYLTSIERIYNTNTNTQ